MESKNNVDTTETTSCLEWCAGYGGISLGLKRAIPSLRTIAFGEIEAFVCANLVAKMEAGLLDAAPIWTDIKTFPCESFRDRVDILVAGYPCQPFSAAGKRLGTEDPRHLWPFIQRSISIIRPRLCFFENVEGHISLGLSTVISDLEELGYKVSWGIFSASEVGAPHQRKRVFILAYSELSSPARFKRIGGESRTSSESKRDQACFSGVGIWPSRPSEPQHGWEPPRVVDSASPRQQAKLDESIGERREDAAGEPSELGNATEREDNGRESRDMGQAAGEGRCGDDAADGTGEGMGDTASQRPQERSQGCVDSPIQAAQCGSGSEGERQTQPPMGGDIDGPAGGLGYAELCISCDNRTDELRLLGNGVVPATAERAFRVLIEELNK